MPASTANIGINSSKLQAGRDINIEANVHFLSRPDPMEILQENVAFNALHDAGGRFDPPKCHPDTRTAVLRHIDQWARDVTEGAKPILWLSGAAGAGKSAIVQTVVEKWKKEGLFSTSFFFWRLENQRNHKTHLIATLSFQLADQYPSAKILIKQAVFETAIFHKNLTIQTEKLLIHPTVGLPLVIFVIDGLDECCVDLPDQDYEQQQKEILEAVAHACQEANLGRVAHGCGKAPTARFKFLIASRPERQIRESFREGVLKGYTFPLSLNDSHNADADVQLFLECKFEEVRNRYRIDTSWPSKDQIMRLVERSSGNFIYPSITMKHISQPRANPIERLKAILDLQPGSTDNPLVELDRLYTHILGTVTADSLPVAIDILGIIIGDYKNCIASVFKLECRPQDGSPTLIERFLRLNQGEVDVHLTDLHSVLYIPSDPKKSIGVMHATFPEYLRDRSRSGDYFISEESICHRWVLLSFRHIEVRLKDGDSDFCALQLFTYLNGWLSKCSPDKNVMIMLWGMMFTDVGPYPSLHIALKAFSHGYNGLSTDISGQPRMSGVRGLIEEHNTTSESLSNEKRSGTGMVLLGFIRYLKRCNIPEIEPSWWRRILVRRRLERAENRIWAGHSSMGPFSNPDIALDDTKALALELVKWFYSIEASCRYMDSYGLGFSFYLVLFSFCYSLLRPGS